jgi:hypothetical protein
MAVPVSPVSPPVVEPVVAFDNAAFCYDHEDALHGISFVLRRVRS